MTKKIHLQPQFWTLEPDVICRLVFVKDVQYDDSASGAAGASVCGSSAARGVSGGSAAGGSGVAAGSGSAQQLPTPGQTELPTCPVCLERLDAHISGIVTTVSTALPVSVCGTLSLYLRQWRSLVCRCVAAAMTWRA